MRFSSFCMLGLLASKTQAVLYGDEQFGDLPGRFWAFYSEGIAVIDPESCSIETTITKDHEGKALPTSWNDVVYMQYDNEGTLEGYVMAGSRVDYSNELGEPVSDAYAISSTDRKVVDTVQVGPRGVHTYAVWTQDEFWSHSDGDGHFYVVRLSDLSKHTHKVSAKSEVPAHGKLLWDEDPATLGNRGFATSTGEQFLFELDIATKQQLTKYDYSSDLIPGSGCRGLHAIAYSAINQHLYTECSGGGGVLEFDVSNGAIAFVHQHNNATGALYETPDGSFVVASNKGGDMLHVFSPSGSGSKSSIETEIQVPGHPSTVSFLSNGNAGAGDYIACSPLTENLNQKHRKDGELVCDYYVGCTGATTAEDVEHGICLHDDGGMLLKKVTEALTADDSPACSRCADSANFDDDGACVCTPSCGSCDPAPTYDDSSSGYMCVDLGAAIAGTVTEATLIPNTGGMKQGKPYGGSADCSFGRTYRTHKRGGIYDASVASAPENSIHIINMQTQSKQCEVALPGQPSKVTYAPLQPTKLDAQEGSSMKASSAKRAHLFFMSWMMVTVGSMVFTWATW
ncbi:Inherit from COG: 40-residue yvtn family beta-propeller repeat protein [Seminavis robusta]|uniref:Inherit from COG: 40-residue yvtn family beta-propeller repeat protein n=1 Tax=Seminavis robusta TaxID=568900 RepID=A0A9N8EQB3_9STRA|nr:Inherit from COG: 40-residue yvtn family beta-propeller repeat protein [Seminavis robusta]|eukprot:Sro1543_g281200.1 Inherit from COG: 40-residue yvtn family beta-propeller repeat protein (569) ;mRNA; f:22747-24711